MDRDFFRLGFLGLYAGEVSRTSASCAPTVRAPVAGTLVAGALALWHQPDWFQVLSDHATYYQLEWQSEGIHILLLQLHTHMRAVLELDDPIWFFQCSLLRSKLFTDRTGDEDLEKKFEGPLQCRFQDQTSCSLLQTG